MSLRSVIACAALLVGCASGASAQSVNLQFDNGRVTLVAQNAPVRTILAEWARLGGTRIVNAERIGGSPVTLELTNVPERQALDTLLRAAVGYVITPPAGTAAGASSIGGVVILATSSAPRVQPPVSFGGATVVQQRPITLFDDPADQDARAPAVPFVQPPPTAFTPPGAPAAGAAVMTTGGNVLIRGNSPNGTPETFQLQPGSPQPVQPPQKPTPTPTFTTLPGSSRPGEITPPPPPPQNQR